MPINITIPTNWATRAALREAKKKIIESTSQEERTVIFRDVDQLVSSNLMPVILTALDRNDQSIKAAPLPPQRHMVRSVCTLLRTLGMERSLLFVKSSDTVAHVKGLVEREVDVRVEDQRLVFMGWEMEDARMLSVYTASSCVGVVLLFSSRYNIVPQLVGFLDFAGFIGRHGPEYNFDARRRCSLDIDGKVIELKRSPREA